MTGGGSRTGLAARLGGGLGGDFQSLWAAQSVSLLGTEVTELALPLTAIYTLHANAMQVGLLGTAKWLPFLFFALLAGVWSDRRGRRSMLVATDLLRAALLSTIVLAAVTGVLTIPILLAATFCIGVCTVLFEVFYYSYVPSLVPERQLLSANSRLQASESTAQIGGPGIGGVLVQLATAPLALLADMASFLFSAAALARIRTVEPSPVSTDGRGGLLSQIGAGLRLTARNPILLTLIGTATFCNLFAQWITVLFTLFCVKDLGLNPSTIGLVLATGALGALLGSMLAGPITNRLGVGQTTLWTVFAECVAFLLIPLAPRGAATAVPILILAWMGVGMSAAVSRVVSISVRQIVTPSHFLGRMNATHRFVSYGVVALGTFAGGLVGHLLGLRPALLIGGLGMFTAVLCVLVSPLRRMREVISSAESVPAPVASPP